MEKDDLEKNIEYLSSLLIALFDKEFKYVPFNEKEFMRIFKSINSNPSKENIFEILIVKLLKKNLNFKINIHDYLDKKEFEEIKKSLVITKKEFEEIFLKIKIELHEEYLNSPEIKKLVLEVRGELPILSTRIYNISLGLLTKCDGTEITLKKYSELTGESLQTNLKILESAKRIIEKKVNRRLEQINV